MMNSDAESISIDDESIVAQEHVVESGLEEEPDDELQADETHPFDPTKIDVITQNRTIDSLLSRLKYGELDLSPDFQRKANLWDDTRKTSLIESLLLRIPIPSLYVSEDEKGNYAVVDGLQRMSAIAHFVDADALNETLGSNLKPLILNKKGLRSLQDVSGLTFSELERPLQRRIIETELTLHVIRSGTPGAVKFNIFSRINEGGLPLKAQEIRNAIYPGIWREKIRDIAESSTFLKVTEGKIRAKRMEDMELVLRAVALSSWHQPRPNDQNLEDYLNKFVEEECRYWDEEHWQGVTKDVKSAMRAAGYIFGEYVFRKYYARGEKRKPINRGLFEAQVGLLARYGAIERRALKRNSNLVIENFAKLIRAVDFEMILDDLDFCLIQNSYEEGVTQATSKGLASNQRVKAMQYIFDQVLEEANGYD